MALADRRREWFRLSRVFDRAAKALAATWPAGVLTAALLISLPELAEYWLGDQAVAGLGFADTLRSSLNPGSTALSVIVLIAVAIGQGGIIHVGLLQMQREPVGVGQGLVSSFRFALPVIGISILAWLGILLGLILLIVPGLMLMTIWVVALPVALSERTSVIQALEESGEMTKGVRWQVFALLLIAGVFFVALSFFTEGLAGILPDTAYFVGDGLLVPILSGVSSLITGYGTAALFHELKWGDRDPTDEITAEVFD